MKIKYRDMVVEWIRQPENLLQKMWKHWVKCNKYPFKSTDKLQKNVKSNSYRLEMKREL